VCWFARSGLVHAGVPAGARLAAVIAAGAVVYFLMTWWRNPQVLREAKDLVQARRGRGSGDEPLASLTPKG